MKNKWIALVAGVLIQTVFGGIYAWSTFVPWLGEGYGLSKAQCGFIFGLTIAVFTLAMTFAGGIMKSKGPRFTVCLGGVLFMLGYIVASLSNGSYLSILIGIGVIAGTGIGLGYSCPLSVGMKWFPQKKGLVTGVAVAGFGGGAILLSSVAGHFLKTIDVLVFFRWLGLTAAVVLLIAAFFLTEPTTDKNIQSQSNGIKAVRSWPFFILTAGMFAGTFSGLLVISNLTQIVTSAGLSENQAIAAISIFAIGNVIGRILWGYAFDNFSYKTIPISLGCFAIFIPLLLAPLSPWIIMFVVALIGFGFGANFVIYASAISRYFGIDSFSRLYPLCFLGYGVAGLTGPFVGGWLADSSGSYNTALYLSSVIVSIATIFSGLGLRVFKSESLHEHAHSSLISLKDPEVAN